MDMSYVGKACPKCAHVRTASETCPEWQCGKCGIAYAKYKGMKAPPAGPSAAPHAAKPEFNIYRAGDMDPIEFKIFGAEMQYVEIELDHNKSVIGEAGSLFYMEEGIEMETQLGDGTGRQLGVVDKLLSAGKRVLAGESLFVTSFKNNRTEKRKVAFAAPYPGKIIPIDLAKIGGKFICAKDAFLCGASGLSLGIAITQRIALGFFGGMGFIMQKLEGNGKVFVHAGGTMHQRKLKPFETLRVDSSCLVGMQDSVTSDFAFVGSIKTALFGGEGLFFATLRGPGTVILQSLPLSRLASRIYAAAPNSGSGSNYSDSSSANQSGNDSGGAALGAAGAAGGLGAGSGDGGGTLVDSIEPGESGSGSRHRIESADDDGEKKGFLGSIGSLFSSSDSDSSADSGSSSDEET